MNQEGNALILKATQNGYHRRVAASAALALGLMCNGCWFGRTKAATKVPPPPAPAVLPNAGSPDAKPADLPALPAEALAPVPIDPPPPKQTVVIPAPKPLPSPKTTPPPRRQQSRQPAVVPAPPPAATPVTPTPAAPAPQLGEFLTTAQRRQLEAELLTTLQRSRSALGRINGSNLSAAQRETADRIRVFISQAEAQRPEDVATALQFARRADLLGQDLLKSIEQ